MVTLAAVAGLSFALLFEQCAPDVSPVTLNAIIQTESSGYPYVVANIADGTSHKFDSQTEASRFINSLSQQGKKFSAGLMQIYSGNFENLGLDNNSVFDPCTNIKAGAKILIENFESTKEGSEQEKLKKSLSKYYSGNETRGFKKEPEYSNTSYVERVEGKVFKVPGISPEQQNQSRSATLNEPTKQPNHQWDIFGDF